MGKTISFIVCSNGYGHLKRSLRVIQELSLSDSSLKINLFAKKAQIGYAKKEVNFKLEKQITFNSELSESEISWIEKTQFTKQEYRKWINIISTNHILKTSDLIVSDNHVLPVRIFDNVVIMGSFLWHDASIDMTIEQQEIAQEEKDFLFSRKPTLLCVKDMVMKESLHNQVEFEMAPWFTEHYTGEVKVYQKEAILVTGGGTELINKLLLEIVLLLSKRMPELDFFLDSKLFAMSQSSGGGGILKQFDFTDESFAGLKAIICRPGVGILTDCVRYKIPAFVINDGFNHEINHNALRVGELGFGVSFNTKQSDFVVISRSIQLTLQNDNLMSCYKKALYKRETGGDRYAATFLINYINGAHS